MSKGNIYTITPNESVQDAAREMKGSSKGCLVVTDGGGPVGIVTERDIVHKVVASGRRPETKVSEIMSTPVITIGPRESASEAARKMAEKGIRRLVVTEGTEMVGLLTVTDLARHVEHAGVTDYLRAVIGRGELLETQEALM